MASILRGFRYPFGYVAGFARSIAFSGVRQPDIAGMVQPMQCLCGTVSSTGFATQAARSNDSLEKSLRRLDQDVKRAGRISRRDLEDILEEIRSQKSATSSQSLLVIRCCGNLVPEELPEVRTKLVQKIWKTLNNLKIPMDISHYNALLRVYLENEYDFSPTEFLSDLESKGIEPNRVTYQRLIARYCQQGDIEGATKILEFMREKQLPVNEHVFNALIMGHSVMGDMDSAAGILQVMKQAGLEPSSDTYTTLLCGYAKQGDVEAMKNMVDVCDKSEIYLLDKDMLEIIYNLAINGHGKHADMMIERLRKASGYNQDAVNAILRLINKGQEETAFKILLTMPRGVRADGEFIDTGGFFIKQLIKAQRPLETILSFCKQLEDGNYNSRATLIALEGAVTNGDIELTSGLLRRAKECGLPIRQHYFWPLICAAPTQQNVLQILQIMQQEFNMTASQETLREYVVPALKEKNYDKLIMLLRSANVSVSSAVTCTLYQALTDLNLSEAARIASSYNIFYNPAIYRRPLLQAFNKTKDLDAYILLVRHIYEGIPRLEALNASIQEKDEAENELEGNDETENQSNSMNQADTLGRIVYDATAYFKSNRAEVVHNILDGLVRQGLTISNAQATRIQEKLGAELTPEISTMLGKLSTGELQPVPIERSDRPRLGINEMSSQQLEKLIETLDAKGENTKGLKRQLLSVLIKEKQVQKLEATIEKLEAEGYVLTAGVFAQIAELHALNGDLAKAVEIIKKTKEKEPDFLLDRIKSIRVAQLYVNEDRIDDAIKFLEEQKHDELEAESMTVFNYNATLWRLLNGIAEKGQVQELKKIFDALVQFKYCEANNVLLGPLIKVHLTNDDLESAINTFEQICQKYRATPWKNELACRLIQKEDAANLQRLTDLSTDIHGEVNSLYDLVFSFIECGRIRQARKILETPGLRSRPQRINYACERYRQEGMVEPLEGLVEATKDLNHIDRMEIYYNLLLSYIKDKQPDKALGLWTKLQEEDINPSDQFLTQLNNFLKENNVEVPFIAPEPIMKTKPKQAASTKQTASVKQTPTEQKPTPTGTNHLQDFKRALKSKDIDSALNHKSKLSASDKITVSDYSFLIEGLTREERLNEAKKLILEMFERHQMYPLPRIFKYFLNKVSNTGDVQSLEEIGQKINPELKKTLSFDNKLCHANIIGKSAENYMKQLEKELESTKNENDLKLLAEKFPRGGAIGILEHSEYIPQFEALAEKYAQKGIISPMNILWMHYFTTDNANAEKIYEKYLSNEPRLMFKKIMQDAREQNNDSLINKLMSKLKSSKISESALGNAWSCWIDVLVANQKFDECVVVIGEAQKTIGLNYINRTALVRVKEGLEKLNKKFPFTIPDKMQSTPETSSSSSSSSSDDEVTNKQNKN